MTKRELATLCRLAEKNAAHKPLTERERKRFYELRQAMNATWGVHGAHVRAAYRRAFPGA